MLARATRNPAMLSSKSKSGLSLVGCHSYYVALIISRMCPFAAKQDQNARSSHQQLVMPSIELESTSDQIHIDLTLYRSVHE
jgi:hypothetical protein